MKRLLFILLVPLLCAWPSMNMGGGVPAAGGGFSANWTNDFTATGCGNEVGSPAATATDGSTTFDCDSTAGLAGDESVQVEAADTGTLDLENVATPVSSGTSCYQFRYEQTSAPGAATAAFVSATDNQYDNSEASRVYQVYNDNALQIRCADGTNGTGTAAISLSTDYWVTVEVDHNNDAQDLRVSATDYDYDKTPDSACTCADAFDGANTPQDGGGGADGVCDALGIGGTIDFDSFRIGAAPGTFYITDLAWGDCP